MEQPNTVMDPAPPLYARLGPRVRAVIRDLFVYAAGIVLLVLLDSLMPAGPVLRGSMIVLVGALVLYEPVLVSWVGGTIGHRSLNLRVVRAADGGRVTFPRALLRIMVKSVTGIVGFLAIELTSRYQGVHDLVAGTVVVPRNTVIAGAGFAPIRRPEQGTLPSRSRRTVVGLAYLLGLIVLTVVLSAVVYSPDCIYADQCTDTDRLADLFVGMVFLVGLALLIAAGSRGYLPGARRRPAASSRSDHDVAA